MNDPIDRQAAIDAIEEIRWCIWDVDIPSPTVPEYIEHHKQMKELMDRCDKLRSNLVNLPSAQPQRMRGKWTYGEDEYGIDGYHCNQCGFFVPWDYAHKFINYIADYNFCPSCGAQMERGGEQT